MKIFTAEQIRAADRYTIENEPVSSIDLMERASEQCVKWLAAHFNSEQSITIFCGVGNNGGDGLVIARLLALQKYRVTVYIVEFSKKYSADFTANLQRLQKIPVTIHYLTPDNFTFDLAKSQVVIDAIFGTGLSRPVEGFTASVIKQINQFKGIIVSIDMPSGLFAEDNSNNNYEAVVKPDEILTFEFVKLAFLLPENQSVVRRFTVLPIGIHPHYIQQTETPYYLTDMEMVRAIYRVREKFSHKGTFGHSLLLVTKTGMAGAGILAARACLRAGSGLVSVYVPQPNAAFFQGQIPEVIVQADRDGNGYLTSLPANVKSYRAIGIGCGIGTAKQTQNVLKLLIQEYANPMVIDADAITILSENKTWLSFLPPHTIFTPHPKELERLIGQWKSDIDKLKRTQEFCRRYHSYVVIKGAYSVVVCPDGKYYFNPTGNAGMATGGSGDVLTGILTALLAQGYIAKEAAILGVYIHGLSGDLSLEMQSQESLIASDIIEHLGKAFKEITASNVYS